jgi:hypothetical protein
MTEGQKLVTLGTAATPWDANAPADVLAKVKASSWHFVDGAITPYEFTYNSREFHLSGKEFVYLIDQTK